MRYKHGVTVCWITRLPLRLAINFFRLSETCQKGAELSNGQIVYSSVAVSERFRMGTIANLTCDQRYLAYPFESETVLFMCKGLDGWQPQIFNKPNVKISDTFCAKVKS